MNLHGEANRHYLAICNDPAAQQKVRQEYAELSAAILAGEGSTNITSSTVNGQSFSGEVDMTTRERFNLLREVIRRLDCNARFSSRTRANFGYSWQ